MAFVLVILLGSYFKLCFPFPKSNNHRVLRFKLQTMFLHPPHGFIHVYVIYVILHKLLPRLHQISVSFIFAVPQCFLSLENNYSTTYAPFVINGVINPLLDRYDLGESYTVECEPGDHIFAGSRKRTCVLSTNGYANFEGAAALCLRVGMYGENISV